MKWDFFYKVEKNMFFIYYDYKFFKYLNFYNVYWKFEKSIIGSLFCFEML